MGGTSCRPAWSVMAKKLFPQQAECISMAMTPDWPLTARLLKKEKPEPVSLRRPLRRAKKLEASRRSVSGSESTSCVTFEELMGLF